MSFKKSIIRLSVILGFLSFSLQSLAQYDDLKNNPNITWIAEFTIDQQLSVSTPFEEERVQLLKFDNSTSGFTHSNRSDWVIRWIFNSVMNNQLECYSDPGLTKPVSTMKLKGLITSVDTVITFNPDTYEESVMIVSNKASARSISTLRMNQVIYFNNKTGNFDTRLIAVAPIFKSENNKSVIPFWIKMAEVVPANFDLKNLDISWAALAFSKKQSLELNFTEVVKNTNRLDIKTKLYQQATQNEKSVQETYGSDNFLDKAEIGKAYNNIDTVTTFDPTTFEEEVHIIKNEFSLESISQFRLVQEWYYNQKTKKLMNRLKAIAPLTNVKDDKGKFRYTSPLYYIRYDVKAQ